MSLRQLVSYNPSNPEHHTRRRISILSMMRKYVSYVSIMKYDWYSRMNKTKFCVPILKITQKLKCILCTFIHYIVPLTRIKYRNSPWPEVYTKNFIFIEKNHAMSSVYPYSSMWRIYFENMCSNLVSTIDATFLFMQFNL